MLTRKQKRDAKNARHRRNETHEGPEGLEPAGVFENGEYASLWAANPEDIVRFEVTPVFVSDTEESG